MAYQPNPYGLLQTMDYGAPVRGMRPSGITPVFADYALDPPSIERAVNTPAVQGPYNTVYDAITSRVPGLVPQGFSFPLDGYYFDPVAGEYYPIPQPEVRYPDEPPFVQSPFNDYLRGLVNQNPYDPAGDFYVNP